MVGCVREINPIVVGHRGWLLRRAFGVVFDDSEAEKRLRQRLRYSPNTAEKASGRKIIVGSESRG